MFLYADIQWAGTALAGINAGNRVNHVTISGSRTSSILDIEETSNVGIPGIWIFKVGESKVLYSYVCTYVYMCIMYIRTCMCTQVRTLDIMHIACM